MDIRKKDELRSEIGKKISSFFEDCKFNEDCGSDYFNDIILKLSHSDINCCDLLKEYNRHSCEDNFSITKENTYYTFKFVLMLFEVYKILYDEVINSDFYSDDNKKYIEEAYKNLKSACGDECDLFANHIVNSISCVDDLLSSSHNAIINHGSVNEFGVSVISNLKEKGIDDAGLNCKLDKIDVCDKRVISDVIMPGLLIIIKDLCDCYGYIGNLCDINSNYNAMYDVNRSAYLDNRAMYNECILKEQLHNRLVRALIMRKDQLKNNK